MEKITKAQNDKVARANALKLLQDGKFEEFLQVGNNSYAVDVLNAEHVTVPVRIDLVVPKVEKDILSADLESEFLDEKDIKEQEKKAKEEVKQKKIARDKKTREKKKEEKGE